MIDTKGNPKEEVSLLKFSVITYIESIDKIYGFYMDNIVKENIDSLVKTISEPWEVTEFTKGEIRESIEKSFNEKESILNSLFFFSVSIIENTLCKTVFLAKNKTIERIDKEIKGEGKYIIKNKSFIENKFEFNVSTDEWSNMLDYYEIRNRFIHNAGVKNEEEAAIYVSKYGLEYDDYYGILIINEKFLNKVCNDIKTFFNCFLTEVENRI